MYKKQAFMCIKYILKNESLVPLSEYRLLVTPRLEN